MEAEILIGPMNSRGRYMLEALHETARSVGVDTVRTEKYRGDREVLATYGLGDGARFDAYLRHREAGGRTIVFDIGYWARKIPDRRQALLRVAVDGKHCDRMLYRAKPSPDRLRQYGCMAKDWGNPDGPIVIVGQGVKGCLNSGYGVGEFETKALEIVRRRWPGKRVWYRPKVKPAGFAPVTGADATVADGSINDVIRDASLVVCQHSNVGVDAVVCGVPVLAEDGAVCALHGYGVDREPEQRSVDQRQRFLEYLASWQWTPREATEGKVWPFLLEALTWDRETSISA